MVQFLVEISNELELSIREVVSNLMFTSGDDENPLPENEDLVIDVLKNELILLLEDTQAVHNQRNSHVKLEDMLSLLRTQNGIISRFIKYLKNRVEMANFMRAKSFSSEGTENICGQEIEIDEDGKNGKQFENELDPMDDIGEVEGEEGEYLKKKRKKINTVSFEENLLEEVKRAFSDVRMNFKEYESHVDEMFNRQLAALQIVIDDMDVEEYNRFASARRISFQNQSPVSLVHSSINTVGDSRKRKRAPPKNNRQLLNSWLGYPPIVGEPAQVFLAFLAKEIISEIVGWALVERRRLFPAEGGPLRHCFYEEPLRRNKRFRKYGRLLI
uniref:Rx_N domain-containing protein n=2 Tax=Caenorhabditis tropicalis TaxID=1561998 RepID=A0A1I7UQR4_9PELO